MKSLTIKSSLDITLNCFACTVKIEYIGRLYNQVMQNSSLTLEIYCNWSNKSC